MLPRRTKVQEHQDKPDLHYMSTMSTESWDMGPAWLNSRIISWNRIHYFCTMTNHDAYIKGNYHVYTFTPEGHFCGSCTPKLLN